MLAHLEEEYLALYGTGNMGLGIWDKELTASIGDMEFGGNIKPQCGSVSSACSYDLLHLFVFRYETVSFVNLKICS